MKVLRPFEVLLLCQKLLISLIELVNAYRHDQFRNPSFPRCAGGALLYTQFLLRPARKEPNVPKLKSDAKVLLT